jgi:hypothetical protein
MAGIVILVGKVGDKIMDWEDIELNVKIVRAVNHEDLEKEINRIIKCLKTMYNADIKNIEYNYNKWKKWSAMIIYSTHFNTIPEVKIDEKNYLKGINL